MAWTLTLLAMGFAWKEIGLRVRNARLRIKILEIYEDEWFRKGYKRVIFAEEFLAFNKDGHFDFNFGYFNSIIQDMISHFIYFHCVASTREHFCLYNPLDMCKNKCK